MNKRIKTVERCVNPEIKVGYIVTVKDGSALCSVEHPEMNFYIVSSYPEIFGLNNILKDLQGTVLETGLEGFVCNTSVDDKVYLLDCLIQIGNKTFRTCSKFLKGI